MKTTKTKRGGRRPGAGRPPAGLPPPVRLTVYLSPEEARPIEAEARSEGVSRAVILRRGLGLQRDRIHHALGDIEIVWHGRGHATAVLAGGRWAPRCVLQRSPVGWLCDDRQYMEDWDDDERYRATVDGPALQVVAEWWAAHAAELVRGVASGG